MSDPPTESYETERLLEQYQQGDPRAIDDLLTAHRDELYRMIDFRMDRQFRARVGVSDVIQEAHLEVSLRMNDFLARRPFPFRVWLRKTAYECLLRLRRRHVKAQRRSVDFERPLPAKSSALLAAQLSGTSPSGKLVEEELAARVQHGLTQLNEPDREVLLMRNYEELTNGEVAQLLDISPEAASKRYGRALIHLRQVLIESGLRESET